VIELTKFFGTEELNLAWLIHKDLEYIHDKDGDLSMFATGSAKKIAQATFLPHMDRKIVLSALKCLGEFMHQGPVILRPGLVLASALLDTKLNFHSSDYRQPFKTMAVEIPKEILGMNDSKLAFVHQPFPGEMVVWMRINDPRVTTYNCTIGPDLPTIEDRIAQREWADTDEEGKFFHAVCRIAVNSGLLAATRQTQTVPLPEKMVKKRKHKNEHVRQLVGRCCQEVLFRDLIVYDRVKASGSGVETGVTYGPQHRRGHWKKVLYGPKHSLYRMQWLNDYWTHKELKFGDEQPTIVMK
jgi:hypothetical protein